MPMWRDYPILTVDNLKVAALDPQDPEQVYGVWSVFHQCAGLLKDGRRYENLVWRAFSLQVLCTKHRQELRDCSALKTSLASAAPKSSEVPALSSSVSSIDSEAETKTDGAVGSRDRGEGGFFVPSLQTTSSQLENLVNSIRSKQDLRPLSPLPKPKKIKRFSRPAPIADAVSPPAAISTAASSATAQPTSPVPVRSSISTVATNNTNITNATKSPSASSDTSVGSTDSGTSIVRGFVPGTISVSKSQTQLARSPASILKNSTENDSQPALARQHGSSNLRGGTVEAAAGECENLTPETARPSQGKKQTSFRDEVDEIPKKGFIVGSDEATIVDVEEDVTADADARADENAIEDSDDGMDDCVEEEIDESAIDDEGEWEDAADEAPNPPQPLTFNKIPSQGQLVSRRSVLSDKLSESARARQMEMLVSPAPRFRRSRTSTPNGPSVPASPGNTSPIHESLRVESGRGSAHAPPPPVAPDVMRRKMFSEEFTHEMQLGMARERSQVNFFDSAGAKRVRGLPPDHPDIPFQDEEEPADDYQSRGW